MSRYRQAAEAAIRSAIDTAARCAVVALLAAPTWWFFGDYISRDASLGSFLAGVIVAVLAGALRSEAPKIGGEK